MAGQDRGAYGYEIIFDVILLASADAFVGTMTRSGPTSPPPLIRLPPNPHPPGPANLIPSQQPLRTSIWLSRSANSLCSVLASPPPSSPLPSSLPRELRLVVFGLKGWFNAASSLPPSLARSRARCTFIRSHVMQCGRSHVIKSGVLRSQVARLALELSFYWRGYVIPYASLDIPWCAVSRLLFLVRCPGLKHEIV